MPTDAAAAVPRETRRLPGVEGVWVFVAADMTFFAILFVSFLLDRAKQPAVFEAGRRTLNPDFGGVNTLILLTSSWFVVRAVKACIAGDAIAVPRWLALACASGVAFGISKAIEYGSKLKSGITPVTSDFYMYYYSLTGIHLLHVLGGCVMLLVLHQRARAGRGVDGDRVVLECGATYWHMVDLLWIVLFPLLYLMR